MKVLIIGAGFSGAVMGRHLAEHWLGPIQIEVWDERAHIAGNCHTERDLETGVMVHQYGPHIFNTECPEVWAYVSRFGEFRPYVNRVKSMTNRGVFSLPINLLTINQFFGKTFNPSEAQAFVSSLRDQSILEPLNFEEQALKMVGKELYEAFFKGYTIKQWGCHPRELPASVLKRLPIRFNYDDNYYEKPFQGIPTEGYTAVIQRILDHPNIVVHLNTEFGGLKALETEPVASFDHVIYTGPIDAFFHHNEGQLGYRTVSFQQIDTGEMNDYQGCALINYPDPDVPWTRTCEHKHFAPWEKHDRTVAINEFSKDTTLRDTPYYPKRLAPDKILLGHYRDQAERLREGKTTRPHVSFLGRLGTYRYMDMGPAIGEALAMGKDWLAATRDRRPTPVFPNTEATK